MGKSKSKGKQVTIPKAAITFREEDVAVSLSEGGDDKGPRKFNMLANSGKVMENHWFWGNFVIDLQGVQIGKQGKPALREHDSDRIVGWTEKITKDDGIRAEGVFAETTVDGQEVLKLADEGFPWQASIYIPPLVIERVAEGQEVEVNGRKLKGPGAVFRKSRLREVSFCCLGADEHTDAQALADEGKVLVEFEEIGKEGEEMNWKEITVEQLRAERADIVEVLSKEVKETGLTEGKGIGLKEGEAKGRQVEKDRVSAIFAATPKGLEVVAIECVKEGVSVEDAKTRFLDELKKNAPPSAGPADDQQTHVDTSNLSVEEKAGLEWDKSPELREEFKEKKTYIAFKKADAKKLVKIVKK